MDVSERACHAATRKAVEITEELRCKTEECSRICDALETNKAENKRIIKENRNLNSSLNTRDENGNNITSISNMTNIEDKEKEKARLEITALRDKLDQLTAINQKENYSHRCEMENMRIEREQITSQLHALQSVKGSLTDIVALQVRTYVHIW